MRCALRCGASFQPCWAVCLAACLWPPFPGHLLLPLALLLVGALHALFAAHVLVNADLAAFAAVAAAHRLASRPARARALTARCRSRLGRRARAPPPRGVAPLSAESGAEGCRRGSHSRRRRARRCPRRHLSPRRHAATPRFAAAAPPPRSPASPPPPLMSSSLTPAAPPPRAAPPIRLASASNEHDQRHHRDVYYLLTQRMGHTHAFDSYHAEEPLRRTVFGYLERGPPSRGPALRPHHNHTTGEGHVPFHKGDYHDAHTRCATRTTRSRCS